MRHTLEGRLDTCVQNSVAGVLSTISGAAKAGLVGLTLILGGATQAQTVASLPSNAQTIENNGSARPVAAWNDFCRRYPSECAVDTSEPAKIAMSPELWKTIVAVNRRVNSRVKPMTDKAHWNVVDRWDFPDDGYGDCEDYVLLKQRLLVEAGWPRQALLITVVRDQKGDGHAVLTVKTDRGEFILDNQNPDILLWSETSYRYVKRQSQGDPNVWVSLGDPRPAPATATSR